MIAEVQPASYYSENSVILELMVWLKGVVRTCDLLQQLLSKHYL